EYQDTNHIQGEIINHLAGEEQNILVVGDDSQSIYSFRGALVDNILNFPQDFKTVKTFKLETNYRSTPEILKLANHSINFNKNKFAKNLRTSKKSADKPALVALDDSYSQADFVCQRILDLQREEGIDLSEIVVLFRAHYQSLELEMEMNKRNIPYVMRGGLRFFEQAHIKDVIAYLRILANHLDEVSWQRVLALQIGIGPATINLIWHQIQSSSSLPEILAKQFSLSAKALAGWSEAKNLLDKLKSMDATDLSSLIGTILASGYEKMVKNNFDNPLDRLADLEQLSIFSGRYDSLDKFLADTALGESFKGSSIVENRQSADEAVALSTIHQAKGLEWKVVFLISLVDGQFPNMKAFDNRNDMEEERRMFYVATTRAQDQLYLTYPIFSYSSGNINQVSQFIKELPNEVYEKWQVKNDLSGEDNEVVYVDENEDPFAESDDVSANFWKRLRARQHNK
ncbi:MAG: ATP-dependent helicase, partial [Candidatus Buchananbacteria bacterium]|nr:ATP-dependent helicase [Candidatus Buchananbacteria bacterium]